jgi:DNA polymerase/3'-5' exonuclease PolX
MTHELRVPGAPAARILPAIERLLAGLAGACQRIELAGAARRGERNLDWVDLLAIPKIEPAGQGAAAHNYLWATLEGMPGLARLKWGGALMRSFYFPYTPDDVVQVNLYTTRPENWGIAHIHRTGSEGFWHWIMARMKARNLAPIDGQVLRIPENHIVPIAEEADLFRLLDMHVFPPNTRKGPEASRW